MGLAAPEAAAYGGRDPCPRSFLSLSAVAAAELMRSFGGGLTMTHTSQPPKIPWWVSYWVGPTTTRSSLRREAWLFFLMAAVFLGIGTLSLYWQPPWGGVIVRPVAFGVLPVGFIVAGIWTMVAASWIDRHQAWDRITTREEREAYKENYSLWMRSLPLGLLLLAVGGAAGALVGWVWETEVGIPVGSAFGALGGLVLGSFLAGTREGIRSSVGKSVDVKSQDAEPNGCS